MAHQTDEIRPLEIVPMLVAKARIDELLGENLDFEQVIATFQAATEFQVGDIGIAVAEHDVLGINILHILLLLLAVLDVTVNRAVLGDRMAPEFASATRLLTNLELDAFLLFILR